MASNYLGRFDANNQYQSASSRVLEIAGNIFQDFDHKNANRNLSPNIRHETVDSYCLNSISLEVKTPQQSRSFFDSGVSSPYKSLDFGSVPECMKKVDESSAVIQKMYRLHNEQEKKLKEDNEVYRKHFQERVTELNSVEHLERRTSMLGDLNAHIKKILEDAPELKQKLRNPIFHDVIDIHYSYQKYIIEFFDFANSMLNDLDDNITTLQWHNQNSLPQCFNLEPYITTLNKVITELRGNLECLVEFRNSLENIAQSTVDAHECEDSSL